MPHSWYAELTLSRLHYTRGLLAASVLIGVCLIPVLAGQHRLVAQQEGVISALFRHDRAKFCFSQTEYPGATVPHATMIYVSGVYVFLSLKKK